MLTPCCFARARSLRASVSSEIPEVMGLADRILVMAEGRVTGELERSEFSQERIMTYAAQFGE